MRRIAIATVSISLLSGCATGSKDTILPQTGPTMKEVYDAHFEHTRQRFRNARIDMGRRGGHVLQPRRLHPRGRSRDPGGVSAPAES
jgi:hypothetical protein